MGARRPTLLLIVLAATAGCGGGRSQPGADSGADRGGDAPTVDECRQLETDFEAFARANGSCSVDADCVMLHINAGNWCEGTAALGSCEGTAIRADYDRTRVAGMEATFYACAAAGHAGWWYDCSPEREATCHRSLGSCMVVYDSCGCLGCPDSGAPDAPEDGTGADGNALDSGVPDTAVEDAAAADAAAVDA